MNTRRIIRRTRLGPAGWAAAWLMIVLLAAPAVLRAQEMKEAERLEAKATAAALGEAAQKAAEHEAAVVMPAPAPQAEPEPAMMVYAAEDPLLEQVDQSWREYQRHRIGEKLSYWHQRTMNGAIVEGDHIRYTFDEATGELDDWSIEWRDIAMPAAPQRVTKEQAEAAVWGEVLRSQLYVLKPGSSVYPVDPAPENPVWVIRHIEDGKLTISLIDSVTGAFLGYGVPPPANEGLSTHGPDWGACPQSAIWYDWANNAKTWYENMGYTTDRIGNSSEADLQNHLQSDIGKVFYELNHGGSWSWHNQCNSDITAAEVEGWIANYANMPFAFIGSCEGLCDLTDNHFSYEFRKGLPWDAVTVGYCHMDAAYCDTCWGYSISWQTALFDYLDLGYSAQAAFNHANASYPTCAGTNQCMRIAGDTGMRLVPNVLRSLCGTLYWPISPYIYPIQVTNDRSTHARCNLTAAGNGVIVYNGVEMVFLNNSELISATGAPISASAGALGIRFVREADRARGMEMYNTGQLVMTNGGSIKVYE